MQCLILSCCLLSHLKRWDCNMSASAVPRWCLKLKASRRTWSTRSTLSPPEGLCPAWTRTCCSWKPRRPPRSAAWESAWTSSSRPRATASRRPTSPLSVVTQPRGPRPVSLPRRELFQCGHWSPRPPRLPRPSCPSSLRLQSSAAVAKSSGCTVTLALAWWPPSPWVFAVNAAKCCRCVVFNVCLLNVECRRDFLCMAAPNPCLDECTVLMNAD